jgi:hypothetical protein
MAAQSKRQERLGMMSRMRKILRRNKKLAKAKAEREAERRRLADAGVVFVDTAGPPDVAEPEPVPTVALEDPRAQAAEEEVADARG